MLRRVGHLPVIRPIARQIREGLLWMYRPIHRRTGYLENRQIILLLGHMRSGSSLLTRVLSSHPQIAGIGELHRCYRSPNHLDDITIWLHHIDRRKLAQSEYVLDKILHNHLLPDASVLNIKKIRCLFLLREPSASIKSIMMRMPTLPLHRDPVRSAEYYIRRLDRLVEYAQAIQTSHPGAMLTYEQLTLDTEKALNMITDYLGLRDPLSPSYDVDDATSRWGRGDGSEHIRLGEIREVHTNYGVDIPDELMLRARETYDRAIQRLTTTCHTIELAHGSHS